MKPITLPLKLWCQKKYYPLTMNMYRNTHAQILNKLKKQLTDIALWELKRTKQKPILSNDIIIEYHFTFPDKIRRDIGNYGAIIDKFFEDALVKKGIIKDDCWEYVKVVQFFYKGIDKKEPRCEIFIKEITIIKNPTPMWGP